MKKKIVWSQDASDDLFNIVSYIKEKSGTTIAYEIYHRIINHVEKIDLFPESGRVVPELISIGILDIREIIETPWRIFYRVTESEFQIISVIDGRRNIEEILYKKVIDGKL
ncbi:type II toxin-antitoxin system RelE/ParE family toxin [Gracilinema caldarium]|uniref:type II toxin-antitoxin system RelE/ParE family toxin n=1 Tax=Gracilinema caldarium TaxID=215591 RepID=UPI0026F15A3E|nr:type II toxin-antitoxin system RelE/ParE family toxin [Gracilinema caldarium]